jgi:uncharacterized membrane protein YsdA (DUF1294 family)/cold shock CspA family protein
MPETAKIIEWDHQRGFGFLQVGKKRVFLHHRDFAELHKRPAVGDMVTFSMGHDSKGRPCAQHAVHLSDGGQITLFAVIFLVCLLVLPALALIRLGVDLRWGGLFAISAGLISYGLYALDKRKAKNNEWRIPENGLHLAELLGGWTGAFLAQRRLRHKCSKAGFQLMFWVIVLAYQLVAYDSLQNWQFTRLFWKHIQSASSHGR